MDDDIIDPHTEGFPYEREARERRMLEALHAQLLRNNTRADEVIRQLTALHPDIQPLRLPPHPPLRREDDPDA